VFVHRKMYERAFVFDARMWSSWFKSNIDFERHFARIRLLVRAGTIRTVYDGSYTGNVGAVHLYGLVPTPSMQVYKYTWLAFLLVSCDT
jgi:hypothetical protein